ncbi:Bro-N domain-containing protein [Desulfobotulus sp.]|uniref:BRO-N domain-containing protein n=1 Tax=Desulfobotulus sp. TaxID=1940337 RepID=UPI002A37212D|nr:BRO family protein [Desulfobotulus sp.]MDY0162181.1 BRO family protein [Desulfobotulus sp.]
MTHHLTTIDFSFQNHTVRTLSENGETWFVAKDVCDSLEIAWKGSDSLQSIPESWRVLRSFRTTLKNQHGEYGEQEKDVVLINEPALYKLAFRSNKPAAEEFTNWVASEVLPAIRKTGSYTADPGLRVTAAQEGIPHRSCTEEERMLASYLVRQVNDMNLKLAAIGQHQQDLVISANNVLRSMSVLIPEVHRANLLAGLRQAQSGF